MEGGMEYTIRVGGLIGIADLLRRFDVKPDHVFAQVGLDLNLLETPDLKISYRKFLDLLNTCSQVTKREDFGLLLSNSQGFSMLGAVGFTMKEAPTIRAALMDLCNFFKVHMNGAVAHLSEEHGLAIWSYRILMPSPPDYRQQLSLAMGIGVRLIRRFAGEKWCPESAYLECRTPENVAQYVSMFKCPIHFNQEINAIVFDVKLLDQKITTSNSHLYEILSDYLAQKSVDTANEFIGSVRAKIMKDLIDGECTIDSVASGVFMKRRTFQRKLSSLGMNYTDVLEETRIDMAKRYLQLSDISMTQIADMLGYSELAAFSRSFKRNTGSSPMQWRKTCP